MVKLLVADDEQKICSLLETFFSQRGFEVLVAHDGKTALSTIRAERPHLVFLDLHMPGLDGLEVEELPASERSYKPGDVALIDVGYKGPNGTLVINISGTFNGARKSRVVTFAVGEVTPITSGTHVTPDNGAPFKTLPSK